MFLTQRHYSLSRTEGNPGHTWDTGINLPALPKPRCGGCQSPANSVTLSRIFSKAPLSFLYQMGDDQTRSWMVF